MLWHVTEIACCSLTVLANLNLSHRNSDLNPVLYSISQYARLLEDLNHTIRSLCCRLTGILREAGEHKGLPRHVSKQMEHVSWFGVEHGSFLGTNETFAGGGEDEGGV